MRVQDPIRKIDVQFATRLRVPVPEWKVAVSTEQVIMSIAHQEKSKIMRRQQEAEVLAKEKAEREQREEAKKAQRAAATEHANILTAL